MSGLREYVISVAAAAIVSGLITSLTEPKTTAGVLLRTMAGLFLVFTILAPATDLDIGDFWSYVEGIEAQGQLTASDGIRDADEAEAAYIKERVAAYILDKAETYGAAIAVDVTLDSDGIPVSARIQGRISPYAKQNLQNMMAEELGISKENQLWT